MTDPGHGTALGGHSTFGPLLKYLRKRARLTQRALASAVGYSPSQISRLEGNQRPPDIPTLTALFVPALHIERDTLAVATFLRLAATARGEPPPAAVSASSAGQSKGAPRSAGSDAMASSRYADNLPLQLTSFIGRERELAEIHRLLQQRGALPPRGDTPPGAQWGGEDWGDGQAVRLLTLTGAGGTGKTRLAIQAAQQSVEWFAQGVWLAELAGLSDPELVPSAVADALGLREQTGRPLRDLLLAHLQPKALLLVLDNCEHLVAACAALASDILRTCPLVRVLTTSREILNVPGEVIYDVPSLSLPDRRQAELVASVVVSESGRLFVERAQAATRSFELTPASAAAIVQICEHLDGIPLALELAAARLRMLPVEQIAARLDDRFRLLSGFRRSALPKHQTLRASIDWSYALLTPPEKALLRRLSVFAGGWTLPATEAVGAGDPVAPADIFELLTRLVDKSLVEVVAPRADARYRLLETVREYGKMMSASVELDQAQRRHVEYFLALAERTAPALASDRQPAALDGLDLEHDNLRAALEFCRSAGDTERALRLAGAMWRYWFLRGSFSEARRWLEPALSQADAAPSVRAQALIGLAFFADFLGDNPESEQISLEALRLARQASDGRLAAFALSLLGEAHWQIDALGSAEGELAEALSLARASGDRWLIAFALNEGAELARRQRDAARAVAYAEESLSLARASGDPWLIAFSLFRLGRVAMDQRDFETARALHAEGLAIRRKLGDRLGIAYAHLGLADTARAQGDFATALQHTRERLAIERELDNQEGVAHVLSDMGWMALQQEDYEQARTHFEESLATCRKIRFYFCIAAQLQNLATALTAQGEYDLARTRLEESLAVCRDQALPGYVTPRVLLELGRVAYFQGDYDTAWARTTASLGGFSEIGDTYDIARALLAAGDIEAARERPGPAARLWSAAETVRPGIAGNLDRWESVEHARVADACRATLGSETFATAWAEGAALALEQAVALASSDQ